MTRLIMAAIGALLGYAFGGPSVGADVALIGAMFGFAVGDCWRAEHDAALARGVPAEVLDGPVYNGGGWLIGAGLIGLGLILFAAL